MHAVLGILEYYYGSDASVHCLKPLHKSPLFILYIFYPTGQLSCNIVKYLDSTVENSFDFNLYEMFEDHMTRIVWNLEKIYVLGNIWRFIIVKFTCILKW